MFDRLRPSSRRHGWPQPNSPRHQGRTFAQWCRLKFCCSQVRWPAFGPDCILKGPRAVGDSTDVSNVLAAPLVAALPAVWCLSDQALESSLRKRHGQAEHSNARCCRGPPRGTAWLLCRLPPPMQKTTPPAAPAPDQRLRTPQDRQFMRNRVQAEHLCEREACRQAGCPGRVRGEGFARKDLQHNRA